MYFVLSGALLYAAVSLAKTAAGRRSREGESYEHVLLLLLRLHSSRHDVVLVLQGC